MKGSERPSITQSKHGGADGALSKQIREGLSPYLDGMLKTIGSAGAGPKRRGKGSIKAAIDGVKLLIESYGKRPEDSGIQALIKDLGKIEVVATDEEGFADENEDDDMDELNTEIDNFNSQS